MYILQRSWDVSLNVIKHGPWQCLYRDIVPTGFGGTSMSSCVCVTLHKVSLKILVNSFIPFRIACNLALCDAMYFTWPQSALTDISFDIYWNILQLFAHPHESDWVAFAGSHLDGRSDCWCLWGFSVHDTTKAYRPDASWHNREQHSSLEHTCTGISYHIIWMCWTYKGMIQSYIGST